MIADGDDSEMTGGQEHKGFWASLADLFLTDDDRSVYAEGLRRGGYLVTVSGYAFDLHDRALDILDDEGSIDLDETCKGMGVRRLVTHDGQRVRRNIWE